MLDNLSRDEEETGSNRNRILQEDADESIHGSNVQRGNLQENVNKRNRNRQNQREIAKIYWKYNKNLDNVTLTG